MDGNKDEAQRCIDIARLALESGEKRKALKFITIARRLDPGIQVEELLAACGETEESHPNSESESAVANQAKRETAESTAFGGKDQNYTEEHARLIREIKRHRDYYAILGVEKRCSAEEIRKAYRKLSLKVHPDKNKAPGSEEAFKTVSKAFKCLSDPNSRRQYDQTGFIDDFKFNPLHTNTRRRRQREARDDLFNENFDPDEIFRSFFFGGGENVFRTQHVHRTRHMPRQQRETANVHGGEFSFSSLLHFLPILLIFLFAYIPFSEPDYSLQKAYNFQIGKVTEKHSVEYYVSSAEFDQKFPQGSPSRENLEYNVIRDYKNTLSRFCRAELQRRQWYKNYPTPHCDRLRSFGVS